MYEIAARVSVGRLVERLGKCHSEQRVSWENLDTQISIKNISGWLGLKHTMYSGAW